MWRSQFWQQPPFRRLVFLLPLIAGAQSLTVLPPAIELTNREARHQLLAEATSNGYQQDLTRTAQWISSNAAVATVNEKGIVTPIAAGEAVITAKANGQSASAKVRVAGFQAPFEWSFRNHVIPVLTKMGCNQGACHGALA
ncbi:MAG: Ig-like domain-containing protein, partial [Acidobacteriia bacterium]|nr:Ig-like domain-containing protein [Terriglobia bacterium]